ncbi:hypothetical protein [Vreelandella sp. EE22]
MVKSELQDATIYTQDGDVFGTVSDASAETKVEVLKSDESRVWIERHHLRQQQDRWVLKENYSVYSADELHMTESEVDETVEDTFPASDPPSFTPEDKDEGR